MDVIHRLWIEPIFILCRMNILAYEIKNVYEIQSSYIVPIYEDPYVAFMGPAYKSYNICSTFNLKI